MQINHITLKKLRKEQGYSQEELAEIAKISKRTIAEIEGGKKEVGTRGSTVRLLAEALRVEPEVLGQEPESDAVREVEIRKYGLRFANLPLKDETILSYDLIKDRYGVEMGQIVNAAPFLFTLLAEMSLADRRRRLKEAEEAMDAFNRVCPEHITGRYWDGFSEKDSIARRDLFATFIDSMEADMGYYSEERNPFTDYLVRLAEELGPNDAIDPEEIHFDADGYLDYVPLFEEYVKGLTSGSRRAGYALSRGFARISQIPKELVDEEAASERKKWLESKISDTEYAEYEDERIRIAQLLEEVSSKGGADDV